MLSIRRALRLALATAAGSALFAVAAPARADGSTIRLPGQHPRYAFEAEPHGIVSFWGVPGPADGTGLGVGFRGSIVLVDNGFVPTINNNVAISFGVDWVHFDIDDWCEDW